MKTMRLSLLLLPALMALAGCAGSGSAVGGNGGPINTFNGTIDLGPSQFSGTQRSLAMTRIGNKYEDFMAIDPVTAMGRLASYVKTQPEFANAVVKTNTLICTFKDNRIFIFTDNFKDDVLGGRPPAPQGLSFDKESFAPVTATPGARKALVMQSSIEDTQGHTSTMSNIGQMLAKRKFAVTTSNNISVNGLKALGKDLALFYIHSHGAMYWWNNNTELRDYSIMTDTVVNDQNEALFADDIRYGRLAYTRPRSVRDEDPDYKGRYCITSGFVRQYITMKGGLVYINACDGGSIGATAMREAFAANGAGAYIGYNGKTTAYGYVPAAYFFDRLLGANIVEKVSPFGRVFTLKEVWDKMGKKQQYGTSYLMDPQNRSPLLKWEYGMKVLTPNIKSLEFLMDDYMAINTDIPPTEPNIKVLIAGAHYPHTIYNGKLMVKLNPTTQGDVVLDVNGHISNERPITSWRAPVKYEMWIGNSPAKLTVNYNLHLRADAYELRSEVDGEVANGGKPFYSATTSTASYQYSGNAGPATFTGSGPLKHGFPANPAHPFSCTGLVFAKDMYMRINPTFFTCRAIITSPAATVEQDFAPVAGFWEFWDQPFKPGWEIINQGWIMRLDTDLAIQAKTYEGRANGVLLYRISWPRVAASPGYDKDTER